MSQRLIIDTDPNAKAVWSCWLSGVFEPYDDSTIDTLEAAYQSYEDSVTVELRGARYLIDFKQMKQIQERDASRVRMVQRKGPARYSLGETKTRKASNLPREFPDPFYEGEYGDGAQARALLELELMKLSGTIRRKPNWHTKILDDDIVGKWKREFLGQGGLFPNETCAQFEYVMAELKGRYRPLVTDAMGPSPVDGVWQSDTLISDDLQKELLELVKPLENVDERVKDWHPGSDNQVLDLVHPSLYPLVFGVTRCFKDTHRPWTRFVGGGSTIPATPPRGGGRGHYQALQFSSTDYQWLPAEFRTDEHGQVKIKSYINNLHPVIHRSLYDTLASIFERFVPLFSKVLGDLITPIPERVDTGYEFYDDISQGEDEDDDDFLERMDARIPKPPAVPVFSDTHATTKVDLNGKRLQVIVKLANIHLTPEKPEYKGGVWHVEGMKNESIVSTGIYYYDNDNITPSSLHFRQGVCEPDYEQGDTAGVRMVYGLEDDGPLVQHLGHVETVGGRCIAFPNTFQHRVASFKLEDASRPGHRKILAFFLVDPNKEVVSTASVAPQQKEWLSRELGKIGGPFETLPYAIIDLIVSHLEFPLSLQAAKEHREKLMQERKVFASAHNDVSFERPFSLCEH